jgi:hypothetical protein
MNDGVSHGTEAATHLSGVLLLRNWFYGIEHAVPCPVMKVNQVSRVLKVHGVDVEPTPNAFKDISVLIEA